MITITHIIFAPVVTRPKASRAPAWPREGCPTICVFACL